jgi:hypothetical protein
VTGRRRKGSPRAGIVWEPAFGGRVWVAHAGDDIILTVAADDCGRWRAAVLWKTGHCLKAEFTTRWAAETWSESKVRS